MLRPEAYALLQYLNAWNAFLRDHHLPCWGVRSKWGEDAEFVNDFIFHPHGHGWHVNRTSFDRSLLQAASEAGAIALTGAQIVTCEYVDGLWRVQVRLRGAATHEIVARFAVDATGRRAWLARQQGATRITLDNLVAIAGYGPTAVGGDSSTFVEAAEDGWWYFADLPGTLSIAAFMTDSDLVGPTPREFWRTRFAECSELTNRCGRHETFALRIRSACTGYLDVPYGDGWLAVGDAAISFDPLSSRGITWSLNSGIRGARAAVQALQGCLPSVHTHGQWLAEELSRYRTERAHWYGLVRRWPESLFWRRRISS